MTSAVERLDYTKAPPGYRLVRDVDGFLFIDAGGKRHASAMHNLGGDWRKDVALVKAWSHYKREHDPPGMRVDMGIGVWRFAWRVRHGEWSNINNPMWNLADARAAAWAWHDRRHALAERLEGEGVQLDMWPAALAWTDDECRECEVWPGMRATPDDFPAVLRRLSDAEEDLAARAMCPCSEEDPEVGALIEAHARDKAAQERYANP